MYTRAAVLLVTWYTAGFLDSPTTTVSAFVPTHLTRFSSCQPLQLFADREENEDRRLLEFKDLEPLVETETRRRRLERENEGLARFEKFGDSLWDLRSEMEKLSHELSSAIRKGEEHTEDKTREILRDYESRDPELVYALAVAELDQAKTAGRDNDVEELKAKTEAARRCLPQFNLEGLWVGKYGSTYDLINITYVADTLIAEKVTGANSNVPKGAITFQADLNPLKAGNIFRRDSGESSLQPIVLTEKASKKWGTKKLPRYSGIGQVAEANYKNNQWMDGQLIIIGDEYFSFAWLPIEQQIFFGRPSPELALKMLRDHGGSSVPKRFTIPPDLDADVGVHRDYVTRCLEATHEYEDEFDCKAFGGIWHSDDAEEECYFE